MAVPTAPIPVHTAYAVPMGSSRAAIASSHMLIAMAAITPTEGHSFVNPCVDLRPTAQTISNPAATSRMSQLCIAKSESVLADAAHEFLHERHE